MFTVDEKVQRAAAGDMAAFEELYREHHRRVYNLCFSMMRNVADAEDVTQEVFVQVFRKLKTFRGEAVFTTWLHRLTVNAVLMHFRKPVVRKEKTIEDEGLPVRIVGGTHNPASMSVIDRIALNDAIQKLSPGYQAVFILHDIAGYEHNEIGEILGCAIGTSKSQLHKARMKLRQLLKDRITANETREQASLNLQLSVC